MVLVLVTLGGLGGSWGGAMGGGVVVVCASTMCAGAGATA